MTIDTPRPASNGNGRNTLEADIIAALWEQAPFPRLPSDAPPEIKDLVIDIENPKKVYTIHRATRRHGIQLLVEKFIVQLRYGCGCKECTTSTCFSCRKRLAGNTPIRRYNPTSARTLAIYLATQDNPEGRLCPHLDAPRRRSDSLKPLLFTRKGASPRADATKVRESMVNKHTADPDWRSRHAGSPPPPPRSATRQTRQKRTRNQEETEDGQTKKAEPPSPVQIRIREKAVSKDYRSFAANVFGTVAFKMLEWLTPNSIDAMSSTVDAAGGRPSTLTHAFGVDTSSSDEDSDDLFVPSTTPRHSSSHQAGECDVVNGTGEYVFEAVSATNVIGDESPNDRESPVVSDAINGQSRPSHSRRNSNARIRTASGPRAQAQLVVDALSDPILDDTGVVSPSVPTSQSEKVSKAISRPSSVLRTTSQLSINNFLDTIPDEQLPSPDFRESHVDGHYPQMDGVNGEELSSSDGTMQPIYTPDKVPGPGAASDSLDSTSEFDCYLPQSLSRLSLQAVNFICDVLQEDATTERHMLEPPVVSGSIKRSSSRLKSWKRKRKTQAPYPENLKLQWKLFAEQSIFNVLSDPQAVLDSFTNRDGAIDSQTLWYCMLRLTRVAPSLVFDSLWIALAGVYAPPRSIQPWISPAKIPQKSFSNAEAASLMSVCFHALIAAAPLVTDPRQLNDMSRIRSHGLSLTGGGTIAKQPTSLCLQYEDALTDDMALRLARRLLTAIPTRCDFDEMVDFDPLREDIEVVFELPVLRILLSSIESSSQSVLNFSKAERSMHEKRIPILLLDWARAVMVHEWEGKPDVSGDGPFGGALSLIEAMYQKRQALLLGDVHFRSEYFGDRLDPIEMPVSWLSFTGDDYKFHLLDYPYIFNPASLVSYFRAINFSRMNRGYEESSSLQSRINAIIAPESLVTEAHQKNVLQDLLKTPSAKYLILDIGRKTVLSDAFDQLWRREERELMRPLKVHLGEDTGEEGFDSGGVQQEFFRLAVADALNPDYGAFTVDERTRMTWFQPGSLQPEWKYELIGLLMSLAVFNGLTLPITFPKALYHKLLGESITELHHIADGWPELASGLTNLLEWNEKDGAVEDVFVLTYEFSTSMFGQPVSRQMGQSREYSWPQFSPRADSTPLSADNPADAPLVTGDNRNAYVSDYIRYLTDVSIGPQYDAFARGFRTCLSPKSLQLLTPSLLQSIVEGTQEIDIAELRRAARYVGWDSSHRAVRDFWAVVRKYDDRMRRRLLEFVTASDRVPVGGAANIQFVIQKNGEEEGEGGHLPTAYTCYGTLLLPEYRDRDVLRERLAMALENAQGFGFA
ncbi:Uu.00g126000.m01.CDS01 [Anthostomella pinea]|uniref:Uu.00g126000.m01.CDS01 n=1 Tax=Anthostomella pinea TaxID=933095 RepID=A0AAI8YHS0_9PEZI|nr:Uu.00g126000.m01.CDS01 [Anthostomella pinea]